MFVTVWVGLARGRVLPDPLVKGFLNLLSHIFFESMCGRVAVFFVTIWCFIMVSFPVEVVFLLNLELYSVVASCNSRHIPIDLLHLSALVQVADRDGEEKSNKDSSCNRHAKPIVLQVLVCCILNACVLDEEAANGSIHAAWSASI